MAFLILSIKVGVSSWSKTGCWGTRFRDGVYGGRSFEKSAEVLDPFVSQLSLVLK